MIEHAVRGEVGERGGATPACSRCMRLRHAERLAEQPIEHRAAGAGSAGGFPGAAQLGGDLPLARLRGVEPAGEQEHMLERRLAGPGAQQPAPPVPAAPAVRELLQGAGSRRSPARLAVVGGKEQLDAVARARDRAARRPRAPRAAPAGGPRSSPLGMESAPPRRYPHGGRRGRRRRSGASAKHTMAGSLMCHGIITGIRPRRTDAGCDLIGGRAAAP